MAQPAHSSRIKTAGRRLGDGGITLLIALLFAAAVLLLAGAPPLSAFHHLIAGSLSSWSKVGRVLGAWIPLTLCACGLLYTFRIGLWNIGVEGQMMMGAVAATLVLRMGAGQPAPGLYLTLSLAAAMAGGGLWALIAGWLKTRGGVNEIFAGLGMNFVAQGVILYLIFGPWKRPGVASMSGTELFPRELWLTGGAPLRISPVGLVLACGAIGVTAVLLRYSRIGLNLRAIGGNANAAFLFGLKPHRNMLLAMMLAGGFAGLAGGLQVSGVYHRLIPAISSNYGYLALLVVMLAGYNVWITPMVALFFACLNVGSIQLPMMLNVDSSLSGVIQGAMVLTALGVQGWRMRKRGEQ